jgi:hypothetical protein
MTEQAGNTAVLRLEHPTNAPSPISLHLLQRIYSSTLLPAKAPLPILETLSNINDFPVHTGIASLL